MTLDGAGERADGGRPGRAAGVPWQRYAWLLVLGGVLFVTMGTAAMEAAPPAGGVHVEPIRDTGPSAVGPGPQDPIRADTIIRDTIRPVRFMPEVTPPDSILERLAPLTDTIVGPVMEAVTQVLPRNVPAARGGTPRIAEAGKWEFDREALLATHATTLHDLLSLVPGIVLVRGGDIGSPVGVTSVGLGPGQIRVFRDGMEDPPMEGGVVDLSQVGLAGLEAVTVERRAGELRIHLQSLQIASSQPYTLLDVGTGDLRTNVFRATFAHPDALGGTLLVALDRMDTDGPFREEPGASYGTHFRYSLFPVENGGIALHYRSRTAQRAEGTFRPLEVNRTDFGFRGGLDLGEAITVEGFGNRTSVKPGGDALDGADALLPASARGYVGARVSGEWNAFWARGEARVQSGDGWPSTVAGVEVGGSLAGWVGGAVSLERERWDGGESGRSISGGLWSEPIGGVSLFLDGQDSRRGVPFMVPPVPVADDEDDENGDTDDPDGDPGNGDPGSENGDDGFTPSPSELLRFGERRGVRAGLRARWRGADLTAAGLRVEADRLFPLGLPFDREGVAMEGGIRTGVELSGTLPMTPILEGLQVSGHAQFWEAAPAWRYLPDRSWAGAVNWHHVGYDTNLEVWFDVGARGRDAMAVPLTDGEGNFEVVPSSLSWFTRLQIRVVTVRVFVHWENFTLRDNLQDIPGRILPPTRMMYGIRWTMWN